MLVTDSQFRISNGKLVEKKPSLWSKIIASLSDSVKKSADEKIDKIEGGHSYGIS